MKILISVLGRFHAFDLAKQLNKHNVLYKINTTFPKFKVQKWGIEKNKIQSNLFIELIRRYAPKFMKKNITNWAYHAQAVSNINLLKHVDVYIGWSGSSLEALIEAKKNGKITIVERGSSHYSYQMNILQEEYAIYGTSFAPNKKVWQRELKEYELADYISIPSTFVKNTFLQYGVPEEKLLLNPYGVDLTHFRKVEKKDKVFRIITSGNLSIRKGTRYLLEAFDQLMLDNAEIWHIGSIHDDMKEWLSHYKNTNVYFLGHKPQNDLYQYYSQGSVFVLMSLEEGMAMVQPQAMACGLPLVISTNTGGSDLISEQGREGYVIPIRDVEKLKSVLLELYYNPKKLVEMSRNAQKRVEKGFTWNDYGDRYIRNLNEIFKSE
ncbi:glycosyltransferase family 4 protein [Acinetobacter qingfengensis]|uniref:Glycosyl transferase family 1 domain-containing protein n=1 Tax=Acinetobacter qingfengensis TaxID=1262585 RepID=A0A1E7RCT1_9GAMM|nr:glycosyltransferase family 4 protein [Acinetobacter qingfengensis]KAA8732061.1 glycosyltransferase family 4 protein [Acinetobacter qingfengensis]OEY97141.1 hypothetical protein BJI46_01550 [Acinetobacter qingfengensis]